MLQPLLFLRSLRVVCWARYRLCWCAGGFRCVDTADFRVDVGELQVVAPADLNQLRTCVLGQTCTLDGLLVENDAMLVMDTCGTFGHFSGTSVTEFFADAASWTGLSGIVPPHTRRSPGRQERARVPISWVTVQFSR